MFVINSGSGGGASRISGDYVILGTLSDADRVVVGQALALLPMVRSSRIGSFTHYLVWNAASFA
jgi:hypothetical protein